MTSSSDGTAPAASSSNTVAAVGFIKVEPTIRSIFLSSSIRASVFYISALVTSSGKIRTTFGSAA